MMEVVIAASVSIVVGLALAYIVYALAKRNLFFAIVEQGWKAIRLRLGVYIGEIGPGLHWIGIPGIYSLYGRKMVFFKSTTEKDGTPKAEPHNDPDVRRFKTTDYPYALPFKDEEDSHGLHLSGILAVMAVIEDYFKAFFVASDWYSIMNSEIMPCFRRVLVKTSYDDDLVGRDTGREQRKEMFERRLWRELNSPDGRNGSIVYRLRNLYGIRIKSTQLRSVDPPPEWRATTLAPYKAQRERDAANLEAQRSAEMFGDTALALKAWVESQRVLGLNPTQAQIEAKQEELTQRALAKTPGYRQIHVRGLEGATTAVVGGGGAGILAGGQDDRRGRQPSNRGGGEKNRDGGPNDQHVSDQEIAEDTFKKFGIYPDYWDPIAKKRK